MKTLSQMTNIHKQDFDSFLSKQKIYDARTIFVRKNCCYRHPIFTDLPLNRFNNRATGNTVVFLR